LLWFKDKGGGGNTWDAFYQRKTWEWPCRFSRQGLRNKKNREQKVRISIYQKSCIVEYTVSDRLIFLFSVLCSLFFLLCGDPYFILRLYVLKMWTMNYVANVHDSIGNVHDFLVVFFTVSMNFGPLDTQRTNLSALFPLLSRKTRDGPATVDTRRASDDLIAVKTFSSLPSPTRTRFSCVA